MALDAPSTNSSLLAAIPLIRVLYAFKDDLIDMCYSSYLAFIVEILTMSAKLDDL